MSITTENISQALDRATSQGWKTDDFDRQGRWGQGPLGTKLYLVPTEEGAKIVPLNIFQRASRYLFNTHAETHLENIANQLPDFERVPFAERSWYQNTWMKIQDRAEEKGLLASNVPVSVATVNQALSDIANKKWQISDIDHQGFLGQGWLCTKLYLNNNHGKISIVPLNMFQRATRHLFGCHSGTHFKCIAKQIPPPMSQTEEATPTAKLLSKLHSVAQQKWKASGKSFRRRLVPIRRGLNSELVREKVDKDVENAMWGLITDRRNAAVRFHQAEWQCALIRDFNKAGDIAMHEAITYVDIGNRDRAQQAYRKAAIDYEDAREYRKAGEAYRLQGETVDTHRHLDAIYFDSARAFEMAGDKGSALEMYKKAGECTSGLQGKHTEANKKAAEMIGSLERNDPVRPMPRIPPMQRPQR